MMTLNNRQKRFIDNCDRLADRKTTATERQLIHSIVIKHQRINRLIGTIAVLIIICGISFIITGSILYRLFSPYFGFVIAGIGLFFVDLLWLMVYSIFDSTSRKIQQLLDDNKTIQNDK